MVGLIMGFIVVGVISLPGVVDGIDGAFVGSG